MFFLFQNVANQSLTEIVTLPRTNDLSIPPGTLHSNTKFGVIEVCTYHDLMPYGLTS